jgi:hypothetical protein
VFMSKKAQKLLQSRLEKLFAATTDTEVTYDSFPDGLEREKVYVNYVALDAYDAYASGIDDLAAALGRFAMFVIPKAFAKLVGEDVQVAILELGVYVRDSFDFEGDQPLGKWRLPDKVEVTAEDLSVEKHGALRSMCPDEWVYMSNWIYRLYREDRGDEGGDFLVYSTLKRVPQEPILGFTFPAPEWLRERVGG